MAKKNDLLQKGVWIKEQQGVLTMGSLDKRSPDVMVVPDTLRSKLYEFETDMIEALYGSRTTPFVPDILDMNILFNKIKKEFGTVSFDISFENPEKKPFKCAFDPVYSLIEHLILSSTQNGAAPLITIKATIVQDHLCIIYRDADSLSDPSDLKKAFYLAKNRVRGSVQFKKNQGQPSYYDITIPAAGS